MSSFVCQDCERSLSSKQALNLHVYRFHSKEITVELNKVSKRVIRNDKGVFVCPYCNDKYYPNPDSLKRHVKKTHDNNEKDDSNSDDDSLVVDDAVNAVLNTQTTSSQLKDQTKNEHNIKRHDYKTSVLSAFDALHQPEKEQEKKMLVAELGDLEPVVYVDHKGEEHHLLAAPKVIGNMMMLEAENKPSSLIFIPKKRKEIDEDSQPDQTPCSIRSIILNSHCRALLSSRGLWLYVTQDEAYMRGAKHIDDCANTTITVENPAKTKLLIEQKREFQNQWLEAKV